jgi:hypothetical protein
MANELLTSPMTLDALKARAYDCLVQIEVWQVRLRAANEAIQRYVAPPPSDKED